MVCLLTAALARGDRRQLVWTYQYQTMPAGAAELEYYFDYDLGDADLKDEAIYGHQLEIEVGVTDRWDFSVYQAFAQTGDGPFNYDGFKLRTRYRLFEAEQYFVDPLLYFEFIRPAEHLEPSVLEGKLILGKNIDKIFSAFNFVVERELHSGEETEFGYDAGIGYEIVPAFSFSIESVGNFKSGDEAKRAVGPTVSGAKGLVWLSMGVLFPLTDATNDFEFRYILGIFL
jgi:hypothetical protein